MTDRVRGLLITLAGDLLTIQRIRPGQAPYWVLPGGGVEAGEDLETALARELREEAAATAEVHGLVHILEHGGERQYFYLARTQDWSADAGKRTGPEFTDPARGDYHLQPIPADRPGAGGYRPQARVPRALPPWPPARRH